MSTARYQRLPTEGENEQEQDRPDDSDRPLRASVQAEFNRPAPAWWKRAILIMVMCGLAWLSLRLARGNPKPQVIYANRYSEEHKYRPAASPVITETLKDGRLRIRGASVGSLGVREEDIPESPAEKRAKEEKRRQEARDAAKARMGLKPRKAKKNKSKNGPGAGAGVGGGGKRKVQGEY